MRWQTVSPEEKHRNKLKWHLFFALWPRKIKSDVNGKDTWAWLEYIGRKYKHHPGSCVGHGSWYESEYKSKEDVLVEILKDK